MPFFSPDDRWVGFSTVGGDLQKVSLAGGPPVPLSRALLRGASWGGDDTILVGEGGGPLSRISANGGDMVPVTTLGPEDNAHEWP